MKSFLSVDLDYWNDDFFPVGGEKASKAFFRKVAKLDVPIHYCYDHGGMLGLVNQSEARHLINVDFHSDLDSIKKGTPYTAALDCGNWVTHVQWSMEPTARYTWLRPHDWAEDGFCHGKLPNPFDNWAWRNYAAAHSEVGVAGIAWENVTEVAIAISPDYLIGENTKWLIKRLCPEAHNLWIRKLPMSKFAKKFGVTSQKLSAYVYNHAAERGLDFMREMVPLKKEFLHASR